MSSDNRTSAVEAVKDTIYQACLSLDDEAWSDWLELCADDFQYAIKAYSPEIRSDMTYLSGNRDEMATLTEMLPKHNTDRSPLSRHATVYKVDISEDGKEASAVTTVAIYQTRLNGTSSHVDAGSTQLFVSAKYYDRLRIENGSAKFVERTTRLDTRRLDRGSHWPL
jgi:methanesulfonate monooxygenase subunit beta